jgi:hypothetical protein
MTAPNQRRWFVTCQTLIDNQERAGLRVARKMRQSRNEQELTRMTEGGDIAK